MEAVFQLSSPHQALPAALASWLAARGLTAHALDPAQAEGPLAGWYRVESDRADVLEEAVKALLQRADVDAAYVKPAEGPPN